MRSPLRHLRKSDSVTHSPSGHARKLFQESEEKGEKQFSAENEHHSEERELKDDVDLDEINGVMDEDVHSKETFSPSLLPSATSSINEQLLLAANVPLPLTPEKRKKEKNSNESDLPIPSKRRRKEREGGKEVKKGKTKEGKKRSRKNGVDVNESVGVEVVTDQMEIDVV